MTRLLLIRHGETTWNAEGRYQGQTDVPLNETGRRQAQALAQRLASEEIDAVYASDLRRALETAKIIAAPHSLPVQEDSRLRELCFGVWEGLSYAEIEEQAPDTLAAWRDAPLDNTPPGGETLTQFSERVQAFLDDVKGNHPEQTVLVAAHGGTLRAVLCSALGLSPASYWQFRVSNGSLSDVSLYEEGAILNVLNDTAHLEPLSARARRERRGKLTLILGGARSGKSDFAQRMAEESDDVLFVATAEAGDEEMRQRIEKHQQERPADWHTLEAPRDAGQALLKYAQEHEPDTILLDCMTVLTSNLLLSFEEDPFADEAQERLMREVEAIIACAEQLDTHLLVVSNEVGLGLVPPYPLGRAYRDLLGRANQQLAEAADEVYFLIAGIPRKIFDVIPR